MSEFHTPSASTQAPNDTSFPPPKCPRERLLLLHVEAAHCPKIFARILRFVTGQAHIPVDTYLENGSKRLTIDIVLDSAAIDPTAWFLSQIEGIPAVKSAEFLDHQGCAVFAAKDVEGRGLIAIRGLAGGMEERGVGEVLRG